MVTSSLSLCDLRTVPQGCPSPQAAICFNFPNLHQIIRNKSKNKIFERNQKGKNTKLTIDLDPVAHMAARAHGASKDIWYKELLKYHYGTMRNKAVKIITRFNRASSIKKDD